MLVRQHNNAGTSLLYSASQKKLYTFVSANYFKIRQHIQDILICTYKVIPPASFGTGFPRLVIMHHCTGCDKWSWVKSDLRQLAGRRKKEKRQLPHLKLLLIY